MLSLTKVAITLNGTWLDPTTGNKSEVGRYVIHKIFGSPNTSRSRLKLRVLCIDGMSLKSAGVLLPTVLPLENLEHLHLFRCKFTGRLYEGLTELKLRLKSFRDQRANNKPSSGIVDSFLASLRSLRNLRLSINGRYSIDYEPCDWPSLLLHAHELRSLDLDDYKPGPGGVLFVDTRRSLSGFQAFCDRASQLQQLSTRSPGLEATHQNLPHGLNAFLVRFECRSSY